MAIGRPKKDLDQLQKHRVAPGFTDVEMVLLKAAAGLDGADRLTTWAHDVLVEHARRVVMPNQEHDR